MPWAFSNEKQGRRNQRIRPNSPSSRRRWPWPSPLRTPLRNVPNVTRARIEIEAVTRYWDKEIEFLHTYRARVTNGTSRGLNLHGIKIARAVCRRADFTSARLVLRRTNEAADVRHLNV